MARFDKYAPLLHELEGGYVNHPADKGGPTNMGVTLTKFREVFGKAKTIADLQGMTEAQWRKIMKEGYWDKAQADYIENQSVAELIADWCVHSGPGILRKVQSIVGAGVDGIIGPKSLIAINACNQKCLHCKVKDAREQYLRRIAETTPSQAVNLAGWLNRLKRFQYVG